MPQTPLRRPEPCWHRAQGSEFLARLVARSPGLGLKRAQRPPISIEILEVRGTGLYIRRGIGVDDCLAKDKGAHSVAPNGTCRWGRPVAWRLARPAGKRDTRLLFQQVGLGCPE